VTPALPWHARLGFSWSTRAIPVVLMLMLGAALGPTGLAILTPRVLDVINPAIPVAVAALGILAGLELTRQTSPRGWNVFVKANLQSLLTGTLFVAGIRLVAPRLLGVSDAEAWFVALILGVAASMSASLPGGDASGPHTTSSHIRDLDAPLPTLVGAVVLASLHATSRLTAAVGVAETIGLALAISLIAWLLLTDTSSSSEQRVFTIAVLLLVGGVADYLSLSALAVGLLTGLLCGAAGGIVRDCLDRDVGYLRHPLVVLMLLTAGARVTVSWTILALAAAYLVLRMTAKLAGALLARRTPGVAMPADLAAWLLPPGVLGLAFAVNAAPMLGALSVTVLSVVVLGAIACQLASALWQSGEPPA